MKLALSLVMTILGLVPLSLVFPVASVQAQPAVSSVTLHRDDDHQERIRIKLVGTHAPQVFAYQGDNPRLICDFPGAGYTGLVKPLVTGAGSLVKGVRIGAHTAPEKKVRVVLDLEPGRKYTYSREFNKEENILNLVLVPTDAAQKSGEVVAKIGATESKQLVITGPAKIRHPLGELRKIAAVTPATKIEATPKKPAAGEAEPPATVAADRKTAPVATVTTESKTPPPATVAADGTPAAGKAAVPPPAAAPAAKAQTSPPPAMKAESGKPAVEKGVPAESKTPPPATVAAAAPPASPKPEAPAPKGAGPAAAPRGPSQSSPAAPPQAGPAKGVATPGEAGESSAPLLQEISYENSSSKGEMIFFRLNGFFPPTVSAVESDQPQVVCDFIGMERQKDIAPVIEARGAYVRKIVTTADRDPKKIKVVLELTAGRDYDLRQVFFKEDNLFVLIVNALDEDRPAATSAPTAK